VAGAGWRDRAARSRKGAALVCSVQLETRRECASEVGRRALEFARHPTAPTRAFDSWTSPARRTAPGPAGAIRRHSESAVQTP